MNSGQRTIVALETTVEWGDCDEAGIVFYPRYFYWMDCAFQRFMRSRDLGQRQLRASHGARGTPLASAKADFRSPVSYDQPLVIEAKISDLGRSSFKIAYRGISDGRLVFEGEETRIWVIDSENGGIKASPIPVAVRDALDRC